MQHYSPERNELCCDICGQAFAYDPENIGQLGRHCCKEHYFHKIGHYVQGKKKTDNHDPIQYSSNVKSKKENDSGLYKTSIETWEDGPTILRCGSCGYVGPPFIKRQKNKVTSTKLGQYLLTACWPVFFAPIATQNEISLFCKKCGALFGSYDIETGCLVQSSRSEKMVSD